MLIYDQDRYLLDDGKNKHRYGELSCATDLTTEKTSDINTAIDFVDGFQSKITDEELNETPHKSPPRGVKIPSEGLYMIYCMHLCKYVWPSSPVKITGNDSQIIQLSHCRLYIYVYI